MGKNIFTQLDTVLSFTLTPEYTCGGVEQTTLVMEHTGFKGVKLMVVSGASENGAGKLSRVAKVIKDVTENSSA